MRNKIFLTLLWLILYVSNHTAQSYVFHHLGVENGLSNNYVVDITQDKQGFIWIATESGLSRFDGKNFTVFEENTSGLVSNALNALLYDETENTMWIGSKSGISMLHCNTLQFENYVWSDSVFIDNVIHFCHAADSGIWIANHHGGIIYYDKRNKQFSSYFDEGTKEAKWSLWCLYDDNQGKLYLGHAQNGLSIIDLKTNGVRNYAHDPENPKSLPGNSVYSIFMDSHQNIWVGTNQGLALFYPQTEEFLVFKHQPGNPYSLIADHIYDIKEMSDGTLWIATDIGGISILDLKSISFMNPEKVRFQNISATADNTGTSSGNIRSLLQDCFGNIWIGNYSSGIDFISHSTPVFNVLPYQEFKTVVKNKPVWGICSDKKQRVWLGGENEIVVFRENQWVKTIDITDYINRPYGQVFSIICDKQGLFWLGIYDDGLLTYNEQTGRMQRIDLGVDNMDIITFFEDLDGRMWIGAEYGVYSGWHGKVTKENAIINQLRDQSVYGIMRDSQGKLWIGTYGGGISVFDKENRLLINIAIENGFCSNSISHLFLDSDGGIWAATRNGIGYFKDTNHPEQYELYSYQENLADTHVRAISEDATGQIWVSTNDGISLWDKEKHSFLNYDFHDGIPIGNFIEGSACTTSDGMLYFGSLNGVCYFNPVDLVVEQPVAPVQIIECRGFNKQTEGRNEAFLIVPNTETVTTRTVESAETAGIGGAIDLPHYHNTFRISFSVPDYSQSRLVEYSYRMEGLEDAWYHTQGENQVTFRNLGYGEYHFKVKARLKNQEWDEAHIASMKIRIRPPLWLTWYAKLFYVLIIGLIAFWLLRSYKNRLALKSSLELERKESRSKQELNDERIRFYTNITHELRTPLTLILGPLEDLKEEDALPPVFKSKINTIHGSAIRLLNLISQLLEFRKTETQNRKLTVSKGDLGQLVIEIGLRYKELNVFTKETENYQTNPENTYIEKHPTESFSAQKTTFRILIETAHTVLYYDAEVITMILNNLLSNAVKYTPTGEIRLVMRDATEGGQAYTEIEVSDTGYGIDSEALPHIFDRYYQAKGKHQASGTGIGLALVKSLADLHEGTLNVRSALGEGTTFTFRLLTDNMYPNALHDEEKDLSDTAPEFVSEAELNPVSTFESEESAKEEEESLPVALIVEDNADIREYIATSLAANYNIITATNGREGLERARNDIPDIVVSDIMMPEMDGIEFCRLIKGDIRTSHIPIVLLTAKDSIRDKEEGYESGADSYLTKPFSAKLLQSRIQNLLESRKKLAELITTQLITKQAQSIQLSQPAEKKEQLPLRISLLDREFLEKLNGIIEENIDSENLDITFIREKMHMSHSTFYRKVKGLTGISANEYIRKIRLKNSLRLLMTGSYNISEAAYMTGFNDIAYFRQCFKKEYGKLPSEYLKTMI